MVNKAYRVINLNGGSRYTQSPLVHESEGLVQDAVMD